MSDAENVKITQRDNIVTLEIDISKGERNEKTGSTRVASSHGWQGLIPGYRYSLNVFTSDKIVAKSAEAAQLAAQADEIAALRAQLAAQATPADAPKRARAPKAA